MNFTFLKKESKYLSFFEACLEAEKSMVVSYATTAILTRRALELGVKWVYSYDNELEVPYRDNLSALIHDYTFRNILDEDLFPKIRFIQKLGNAAVHSYAKISKQQAVLALHNLFEFALWIDYCYSETYEENLQFNEELLADKAKEKKTKQQILSLYKKLGEKDKKLEEIIKENETLRKEHREKREENTKTRTYNVDEIPEYQTRKLYIDVELGIKGWTIGGDCLEEVKVQGMPNPTGEGFVDYVLYDDNGKPLAVVEAKKTSVDPKVGKEQARLYAQCLEAQYGVRPIIFYTNGFEYYIWDNRNYPPRRVSGIYTKYELQWTHFKNTNKFPLDNLHIKDSITNRPYQKKAIQAVCESLSRGRRKALLVMATGSGKTRTAISLVDVLIEKGWIKNILFLADRIELVRQAKKNFKNLLPDLSLCNLLDSKDSPESRMIFSTYPTMMNAIDETKGKDDNLLFTSGHFDLIIVDESHRSIYKKYQAIFEYFDAALIGLTATPKDDIDINTYRIFELENNNPTFSYDMDEAVGDEYLVPYKTIETKVKFLEEGIHYDDLTDKEKDEFDEIIEDDVKDISSSALNQFLFNTDTVDKVLFELMNNGIKIEGGDKLGKTIIFAKNQKHAEFIIERFDILYPYLKGEFCRTIHNKVKYVDKVFSNFSYKDKLPQIAVSVDMLDTGVDIPEVVNLVFFKKVRSLSKFIQMIGRGTRLCPDLFGVGQDKEDFLIFDYCRNFEFFLQDEKQTQGILVKSLTENLFNIRISIAKALQHIDYQSEEYVNHRQEIIKDIVSEIKAIDESLFNARMKLRFIHKYNKLESFGNISEIASSELEENLAPLVFPYDEDEMAKRFDLLMYTIELAILKGQIAAKPINRVMFTAEQLSHLGSIQKVKYQTETIEKVQTNEFWSEANIFDLENVRKALRDLIKYLEAVHQKSYYTNFQDEILSSEENSYQPFKNSMENYKKRVNHYLKKHKDDLIIFKLRHGQKLNESDVKHLEHLLWYELGTEDEYKKEFGNQSLTKLVLSIVGLDRQSVNELFSEFLSNENLSHQQMEFVQLIVNHVVINGGIDVKELNSHPYNKNGSVVELFVDKVDIAKALIKRINDINDIA